LNEYPYSAPRKVLFLCTGNFFRSPFAELYFNHLAQAAPGRWVAISRGLSVQELSPRQRFLRLSPFTTERLSQLKVAYGRSRYPKAVGLWDLESADRIIAVHGSTHRPMLEAFLARNPPRTVPPHALSARVVFWEIEDLPAGAEHPVRAAAAHSILDRLQGATEQMLRELESLTA
jgi:protein-tyrosine phosphatase